MTAILLLAVCLANAATGLSPDLPASYRIEIELNDSTRILSGWEDVLFINPTPRPLDTLCFHLYPNAFEDTSTVFCREDEAVRSKVASGNISRLDISDIKLNGRDINSDDFRIDGTLMYVNLPNPLQPGHRIEISMRFELLIPETVVRFGYDERGNYLFAHWYPILCGYQKGRLMDREYHSNSEFFSNFASYDVTMKIPRRFTIGSTGNLNLMEESDSISVWHAIADTVIGFAFACGPDFDTFHYDTLGVSLHYLLTSENAGLLDQTDKVTIFSLSYCSERLFEYPYRNLTVVDFNQGSAGLELPGLIAVAFSRLKSERSLATFEATVAHEIAHQWFYATIATNEFDEPWLDEGLTSYFTDRIIDDFQAKAPCFSLAGYRLPYRDLSRAFTLFRGASYPIDLKSWEYPGWFDYRSAVYTRAKMVIQSLEAILGDSVFALALKDYAEKYRFGHPDGDDFKAAVESVANLDLSEFYSQFISGTARVDYAVTSLEYDEISDFPDSISKVRVKVKVHRKQDGILSQTITLGLRDGSTIDTVWDGRSRVAIFEFLTDSKPLYAAIDERAGYPLDENSGNDRLYFRPRTGRMTSFEWDTIFLIEFFFLLFL